LKNEQWPLRHVPEQQLPSELQTSPSVEQLPPSDWQVLPAPQSLLQHCVLEVHAPPPGVHCFAVEHMVVCGSQYSEQHSLDSAQVAPAALHWFGPVQRSWPSTSWSQRPLQHWLPVVQELPVGRHDVAGTSHRPLLQWSEQQSVSCAHDLAYGRHVEQFTPTRHELPKQQPFAHEVALHWHAPLTHAWPVAHCVPPPHVHAPEALQPSASVGSHATHACPPLPQAPTDVGVLHVLPLQQPVVQVMAHVWHAPMLQALAPQSEHEPPNAPQMCGSVPVWHLPIVSQQPWQLVPLHTHLPFTHASP
jgi:hypothetical protein